MTVSTAHAHVLSGDLGYSDTFDCLLCASLLLCLKKQVSPFDRIRTNLMNQPTDKKIYNGFVDCVVKTIQRDGVSSLWRGFIPIWARFPPTATIQLLTIEVLYGMAGLQSI